MVLPPETEIRRLFTFDGKGEWWAAMAKERTRKVSRWPRFWKYWKHITGDILLVVVLMYYSFSLVKFPLLPVQSPNTRHDISTQNTKNGVSQVDG